MAAMEREYGLFKFVERRLCQADILRAFTEVDDFLNTAARIMNRRKSRAGRSLENHVASVPDKQNIPARDARHRHPRQTGRGHSEHGGLL